MEPEEKPGHRQHERLFLPNFTTNHPAAADISLKAINMNLMVAF